MKNLEQFGDQLPLRALRTYEAFARLGTVIGAAEELAITPSAVSHQLHLLESFLNVSLTLRQGRNLVLTDEGREYYRAIRSAFSLLRDATDHVRANSAVRQVTISLIPLFGMGWFIPHLALFQTENPDVDIHVSYAHHRNYLSDAADLSIRFGTGQWAGYSSEKILSGKMVPVCSKVFYDRHGPFHDLEDLLTLPLLHDEERLGWLQWFDLALGKRPPRLDGPIFEDGQLTLAATLSDLGCALMREPLVQHQLQQGSLIKLSEVALDDGRDYYLCQRAANELTPGAISLRDWMYRQIALISG
ncbi:DNA-binding transcriptional LysR family regulator [Herbaspirillum sp. Sphag1AN]|uniref:LysR substrate-binding domain-containing protein n=1 Tax=unclassified Herbaspirillum TaxID=2624150 RepID=UPI0016219116|nr:MULTISPECIES: LysR substrate-binding domain-containing protein [unclassified Herbaspirillum]MBB3211875.1 DNA-binding transcriptional LysR family regulator [Herbaspirillum sp. Sphag1AN]MBB3244291.1 DNA-binding transcriptional LysR family regulator [Herbaspirillum sp. Sphag64]